jgi:hypothetical protein
VTTLGSSAIAAALLIAATTLTACKSKPPAPVPTAAAAPAKPAVDLSKLTDEQLVAADQSDGLGLALRIPGNTFHTDEPIPLHLLIENFGARIPIAAGLCSGVFLAYEDAVTHESGGSDLVANPRCTATEPYPDTVPLERGKLKIIDTTSLAAAHLTLVPGHYLLTITWKAIPAGPGTLQEPLAYANLRSNSVPVTIIP